MRPLCLLAASALLASPALAQQTLLTRSGGSLGKSLDWEISSPKAWLLLPSLQKGPTPLSLLDPRDSRRLSVGLDLISLSTVGSGGGTARKVSMPLPNSPSLAGLRLRAQFISFPGKVLLIDQVSNATSSILGQAGTWQSGGKMLNVARALPTVSELKDGRVLVAGGGHGTIASGKGLDSSEFYDRDEQRFVPGPRMQVARALHVAVTLKDGRVLLIGGLNSAGKAIASCEIFDPQQKRFFRTGSMKASRALHAAALLPSGKVLVCGGAQDLSDPLKAVGSILKSSEIFDPSTGRWSQGPNMGKHRAIHAISETTGGRLLLVGGVTYGFLNLPGTTKSCELYDPKGNRFVATGSLPYSAGYPTLFPMRKIGGSSDELLAVGGINATINYLAAKAINRAAIYNGKTGRWTSIGNLPTATVSPALGVAGGILHVIGGAAGSVTKPMPIASCARYDAAAKRFYATTKLPVSRGGAVAISLRSGQLLIAGGGGGSSNSALDSGLFWFAR
ncbi:MAG: hypothetical protein CSA62_04240 [Planctomycetota bacterium]|nr:MAG: hypothetical protein CSA62_04240 [Planctomycetota bacterium]